MSDQDTVMLEPAPVEGSRSRLVLLLVGLGVVALAAIGAAIWLTGSGGDDPDPVAVDVAQEDQQDAAPAPAVDDEGASSVVPAVTYEVFLSRDPFEPVVPEDEPTPVDDPVVDDPDADDPDADDPDADDPDADDPDDVDEVPDDRCRDQGEIVCNGQVVTLIDITTGADGQPIAVIQVDSTIYEVGVGDTFAEHFVVRAIDPPCVSLLFGDDGFQLCEGDQVLK